MVRSAEEWLRFNEGVMAEFREDPDVLDERPQAEAAEIISAHAATTPVLADYVASASGRAIPVFKMRVALEPKH